MIQSHLTHQIFTEHQPKLAQAPIAESVTPAINPSNPGAKPGRITGRSTNESLEAEGQTQRGSGRARGRARALGAPSQHPQRGPTPTPGPACLAGSHLQALWPQSPASPLTHPSMEKERQASVSTLHTPQEAWGICQKGGLGILRAASPRDHEGVSLALQLPQRHPPEAPTFS